MPDTNALAGRIDAEFAAIEEKYKKGQVEQVQAYQERQKRLQKLTQVFDRLREVWKPRLEVLVAKFGDRVTGTPQVKPSTREITLAFKSTLAVIRLKFSANTDRDINKVILSSNLEIVPILMKFDAHSELEFPIDAVDPDAAGRWVDDRIVSFVKTYLSLHENDYYLKDEMVEDPVARIRFPKFAAGATLEVKGQTYYFVGEETRAEFQKTQASAPK
jgi:YHS domain-containing protein